MQAEPLESSNELVKAESAYVDRVRESWSLRFEGKEEESKAKLQEADSIRKKLPDLRATVFKTNPADSKGNLEAANAPVAGVQSTDARAGTVGRVGGLLPPAMRQLGDPRTLAASLVCSRRCSRGSGWGPIPFRPKPGTQRCNHGNELACRTARSVCGDAGRMSGRFL